jgi:hypothetical protein
MRGLPYYEEPEYHKYMISRQRKDIFPPDSVISQLNLTGVKNLLDFGMGNGYFLSSFYKYGDPDLAIWGAECQEILIDQVLHTKVKEKYESFIPFYIERNEHPLLPEWLPEMDMIFCSCVMSTFADPSLAIKGIARNMKFHGSLVLIDWEKTEAPSGPAISQKVSKDRMLFFTEDAGFKVKKNLKINQYFYGFELEINPEIFEKDTFRYGFTG